MKSIFISYSWEDDTHIDWVKTLATKLRKDGIDAKIDQWELSLGDQLTEFMERSIRENDYVLVICTPTYKIKSDKRQGGVGYEGDIITAELFGKQSNRKFIPVLKSGNWESSAPTWLGSKLYIDLSNFPNSLTGYSKLEETINGKREIAPPIDHSSLKKPKLKANEGEDGEIRIIGVMVDKVTMPKNDGTRGSALYEIPFRLSKSPSFLWKKAFINAWNYPASFTTMHRPGIASIYGNVIYLNGTTMEEVKECHKDTLIMAVKKANNVEEEHLKNITNIADELDFN